LKDILDLENVIQRVLSGVDMNIGAFWSGYEHYQSMGVRNLEESTDYLRRQQQHHGFKVVDDRQQTLQVFPPSGDAT